MDGSVIELYILVNFLSSCSVNIERIVLKLPTLLVHLSMSLLSSVTFCFPYFVALLIGAYTSMDYLFSFSLLSSWFGYDE